MGGGCFGFAGGLEGKQALFVAEEFAGDALFVDGEQGEFFRIAPEGAGGGHGGVDLGVQTFDFGIEGVMAEGEDVIFDGAGAVETPFVFGDGLGDLEFEGTFGLVGFADGGAEGFEGVAVLIGEDGDLAGEAVTPGVEGGADFALRGFGAGGLLGVAAVGFELLFGGWHGGFSGPCDSR